MEKIFEQLYSLEQIDEVASALGQHIPYGSIVGLDGEMGAGKTTFSKALFASWGVQEIVQSPTYNLVHTYTSSDQKTWYHFDLYRLNAPEEALDFGWFDYLDSGCTCLVEWPEKVDALWPENYYWISLLHSKENMRLVTLSYQG